MPTPRGGVAATFGDGRIVAAGGEEPTRVLPTVEAYDIATGTWSALPSLPVPRHGIALATVGNSIYAVGGATADTRGFCGHCRGIRLLLEERIREHSDVYDLV